jgi:hypothetical protein
MPIIFCWKCGETNCLDPHAYRTTDDAAVKYEKCQAVNRIALEDGELKKQE